MKVAARIIRQAGRAALVEWLVGDVPHRAYVPADMVEDGAADPADLALGIPYGAPWGEFAALVPGAGDKADELTYQLHRHGIWTVADLYARLGAVRGAVKKTYGTARAAQVLGPFIRAARAYDRRE